MKKAVNYRDIAKAAGVSLGTVSLALRRHASIPKETQARVRKVAEDLGYRPNPRVAELMGEIRRNRSTENLSETVAVFWCDADRQHVEGFAHLKKFEAAIAAHLREQGYDLDVFYEDSGNVERILRARGIRGLILAPLLRLPFKHLNWQWDDFSVVIAGSAIWRPEFNRVRFNHFEEMALALHELRHLRAQRVALITDEHDDSRSQRAMLGGFLAHSGKIAVRSNPVFAAREGSGPEAIAWLEQTKPDVVIVGSTHAVDWVRQSGLPIQMVFVSEYVHSSAAKAPGIRQDYARLGEATAAQLFGQLSINQMGIPAGPIKVFITGTWHPGKAAVENFNLTG